MVSLCFGSIHVRWSSSEQASSFFEKVQLHFELADLLVELVLLGFDLLELAVVPVAEDLGQAGHDLFLPTADLGRVHAECLRDLGRGLVPLEGSMATLAFRLGG